MDEKNKSLLEHYIGQAVLTGRLNLEENDINNAEKIRNNLIKTLEDNLNDYNPAKEVVLYLRANQWDSFERLEKFDKWYEERYGKENMQYVKEMIDKLSPKVK